MSITNSEFITNAKDNYQEAGGFRKTVRRLAVIALASGAFSLGVSGVEASVHSNDVAGDALAVAIILGDIGVSTILYDGITSISSAVDEEYMKIKQNPDEFSNGAVQEGL